MEFTARKDINRLEKSATHANDRRQSAKDKNIQQ